jgi:hypothetical protein
MPYPPPLIGGELYFVYKLFVVTGIMIKTFTLKTEELSCTSQSHLIPEVFTTKYNSIIYNPLTSATDMKRKIKQRSSIIPPASYINKRYKT